MLVSSFPNRKLNLRFGFFLCKSATTSQSRLRRASIPTPFVPSGHFPLIGGIGPWKGSQGVRAAGSAYQRRNTRRALDSVARATSSAGMPRRSAIFLATYGTRLGSLRRDEKRRGRGPFFWSLCVCAVHQDDLHVIAAAAAATPNASADPKPPLPGSLV